MPCADTQLDQGRRQLTAAMAKLHAAGITCAQCAAPCCTFERNTMRITPAEAQAIWQELIDPETGRLPAALVAQLQTTITRFGLDRPELGNGQRRFLRRAYTCPFFAGAPFGCQLPQHVKPYGCLAYNPQTPGVTSGEGCRSDQDLLAEVEATTTPSEASTLPIPLALLALDQASKA